MNKLRTIAKFLLIVVPFIWVGFHVDYPHLYSQFRSIPLYYLFLFFALPMLRIFLQTIRFKLLMNPFTHEIDTSTLFALDMKAKYYSIILPSSVGQDIVRGALLRKHMNSSDIIASSIFFRITGISVSFLLASLGFLQFSAEEEIRPLLIPTVIAFVMFIGANFVLFSPTLSAKLLRRIPAKCPQKLTDFLHSCVSSIQIYRKHPRLVMENIALSIFTQTILVLYYTSILYAVTGVFSPLTCFAFVPLVEIIVILVPFLPNGAGIREGLYILLFSYLGEPKENVFLFLTYSLTAYLVNLGGLVFIISEKIQAYKKGKVNDLKNRN